MAQSISVVIIDSNADSINNMVKYIKTLGDNVAVENRNKGRSSTLRGVA